MTDVKVESSPLWMQQRLISSGLRPINNLVDITNYVLLEFGQPMHVFDYDKLSGNEINVRCAKSGEKILALDGKSYELNDSNLIITDKKNPVAIAGVMGGEESSVTSTTKTAVFESANFNALIVRKTSRLLNLQSESSSLFEKSLAPEATSPALGRAIELAMELAGGKVASKIFDVSNYESSAKPILLNVQNLHVKLGVEIKPDRIKKILIDLGFIVSGSKDFKVTVPWWRQKDVEGEHDLIEEVARIYGYHNLPFDLPSGELPVNYDNNQEFTAQDKVKDILVAVGYSEVYNYSFISAKQIKDSSLTVDDHIKLFNPLNTDFEYMRTSLVPGLLTNVAGNENLFKVAKFFELSHVYISQKNDLPDEKAMLAVVVYGKPEQELFYELKGVFSTLIQKLNIIKSNQELLTQEVKFWQKDKTTKIIIDDNEVGNLGIINSEVLYLFGIKSTVGIMEIDFSALLKNAKASSTHKVLSRYPQIELDLSMEIDKKVLYRDVQESIIHVDKLIKGVDFLSVFEGNGVADNQKALAIRIVYRNDGKTLTMTDAQNVHNKVVGKLKKEYNIGVR